MPNQEKSPRAWVYARIPGDCAATRASYDACCRQAGDNGCTVVGGSIDYKGHGPLRDGYQCMLRSIRDGKVNCVYVSETPSVLSGINRIQRWSQSKPPYLAFLYFFASIYSIQSRGQGCHQE